MGSKGTATVSGVPETLRALRAVDPALRRQVPDRLKAAAAPLLAEARSRYPRTAPLSGWSKGGRLGYDPAKVARSPRLKVRASRGRRRTPGEFTLLALTSGPSPAAAMFEMVGRKSSGRTPQGRAFVAALNRRSGRAARALWPAAERQTPEIVREVNKVLKDLERTTSTRIRKAR